MTHHIRIPEKEKLTLISNISTMLAAGIPILEAVDSIMEESKGPTKKFLKIVHKTLNEGRPLSEAFDQAPDSFDAVTVNLVKAGEEAGTLEDSLKNMAKNIKKEAAFRATLRSSLIYPAFIIITFFGVLVLILTFVVPKLSKVFSGMSVTLPPATRFIMTLSDLLLNYYLFIIGGVIFFFVATWLLYRSHKRAFINALLSLPLLRRLGTEIDLTRFTRSMSTLLHAGIPIVEALRMSEEVTIKKEVRAMLHDCQDMVSAGKPLSEGIRLHKKVMPGMMIQIIEAAESSGTLDSTLEEVAEHFEEQVNSSLKTFTTLLEPISLVVIGGLVGAMMLAVIAPIYNMIGQLRTQ